MGSEIKNGIVYLLVEGHYEYLYGVFVDEYTAKEVKTLLEMSDQDGTRTFTIKPIPLNALLRTDNLYADYVVEHIREQLKKDT